MADCPLSRMLAAEDVLRGVHQAELFCVTVLYQSKQMCIAQRQAEGQGKSGGKAVT